MDLDTTGWVDVCINKRIKEPPPPTEAYRPFASMSSLLHGRCRRAESAPSTTLHESSMQALTIARAPCFWMPRQLLKSIRCSGVTALCRFKRDLPVVAAVVATPIVFAIAAPANSWIPSCVLCSRAQRQRKYRVTRSLRHRPAPGPVKSTKSVRVEMSVLRFQGPCIIINNSSRSQ